MNPSILVQVVNAIANEKNVEPDDLELRLQRYVPIDAIQYLADHQNDEWKLEFKTSNHVVEVNGDHTVVVDTQNS
jgi:hypothetical protein